MKGRFLNKHCLISVSAVLFLALLVCSCSTSRIIPYTKVGKNNNPDIIELKDDSRYIIYSSQVRCRLSGDSIVIFNKRNLNTYEIIPGQIINRVYVIPDIKNDSFWNQVLDILLDILIVSII